MGLVLGTWTDTVAAKVLSPLIAAGCTALFAYLVRRQRIPRLGRIIRSNVSTAALAVWRHTDAVVYISILATALFIAYDVQRQREATATNRIVLCLLYGPLLDAISLTTFKVNNPHVYGLNEVAVENLRAQNAKYRLAARALKHSGCTR